MRFNLVVAAVLTAAGLPTISRQLAAAEGWRVAGLVLCCGLLAGNLLWRIRNRGQEPAVFAAVTYLAVGAVVAAAEIVGGDYLRGAIIVLTAPILPAVLAGDGWTRPWINRVAGRLEAGAGDGR